VGWSAPAFVSAARESNHAEVGSSATSCWRCRFFFFFAAVRTEPAIRRGLLKHTPGTLGAVDRGIMQVLGLLTIKEKVVAVKM